MGYPETFRGMVAMTKEDGQKLNLTPHEFKPKTWTEDDVDIKISCCGICGSCLHTIQSGWGEIKTPCLVGHEVVGKVVKAGSRSGRKVGERVGVGAQSGSCLECDYCKDDYPMYCTGKFGETKGMVGTYQSTWEDGSTSMGGYADYIRCRGAFCVPIPDGLEDAIAAPMMCAGITTYRPLIRFGAGPGKKVGIVGIGGLGHLGLLWSSALGAETFAISHSDHKKHDAEELGVKPENFIVAADVKKTAEQYKGAFDLLVVTSFQEDMPLDTLYLPLLKPEGTLALCGLPEKGLPSIKAGSLIGNGVQLAGTIIGGPKIIEQMLKFAVEKNIKTWVNEVPMDKASEGMKQTRDGKAKYRVVLVNPKDE